MPSSSLVPRPSRGRRKKAWYRLQAHALDFPYIFRKSKCVGGVQARKSFTEQVHGQSRERPDSGKYQHASTRNRAEKTANWLAIDSWKLIFTMSVHSTPEKVLILGTNP